MASRNTTTRETILIIGIALAAALAWRLWWPSLDRDTRAAATIEATELVTEFRVNQAAAHHRFAGKVVEVHGRAHSVRVVGDAPVLSIGVLFTNLDCHLARDRIEVSSRIAIGKPISVNGKIAAAGSSLMLKPCVLM